MLPYPFGRKHGFHLFGFVFESFFAKKREIGLCPRAVIIQKSHIGRGTVIGKIVSCGHLLANRLQIAEAELVARCNVMSLIPFVPVINHQNTLRPCPIGECVGHFLHTAKHNTKMIGAQIPLLAEMKIIAEIAPALRIARSGIAEAGGGGDMAHGINGKTLGKDGALGVNNILFGRKIVGRAVSRIVSEAEIIASGNTVRVIGRVGG